MGLLKQLVWLAVCAFTAQVLHIAYHVRLARFAGQAIERNLQPLNDTLSRIGIQYAGLADLATTAHFLQQHVHSDHHSACFSLLSSLAQKARTAAEAQGQVIELGNAVVTGGGALATNAFIFVDEVYTLSDKVKTARMANLLTESAAHATALTRLRNGYAWFATSVALVAGEMAQAAEHCSSVRTYLESLMAQSLLADELNVAINSTQHHTGSSRMVWDFLEGQVEAPGPPVGVM
ncbi:hypothetical protein LTR36_010300 [Oleoguttula mirabilis]|uniref:Uncharacterized protein n=1 Tax=Oleoguttula mirabilis TaxID=1507867 RepID=A0AAV9J4W7_9PEZI|nr:hypothetical protein LTR36_010300 [Oleoguttula mirabilis]